MDGASGASAGGAGGAAGGGGAMPAWDRREEEWREEEGGCGHVSGRGCTALSSGDRLSGKEWAGMMGSEFRKKSGGAVR